MTAPKQDAGERRLAAIMAADVTAYSQAVAENEDTALAQLAELRGRVDALVAGHRGRIFSTAGDGLMVEFQTVGEALRCALAIQAGAPDPAEGGNPMRLRIGLHMGDVVVRDGTLLGDAVNVAARIEALAEPGGICVSGAVREHLGNAQSPPLSDLGERELKNIPRRVRVFRVDGLRPGGATRPAAARSVPPASRFSIAVLPFTNMSGDAQQEYFADGITEDIITALSRLRRLFVIARNSTFVYKGRAVDVPQVGRELGVRYVLEGSVRRGGDRLRITGQLIDAETGAHIWADRFDGALDDVFELQDEVTSSVAAAIEPSLTLAETERARQKPTESLDAYDLWLRALSITHRMTRADAREAIALLARAMDLDPDFALAWALSGYCQAQRLYQGWTDPPGDPIEGRRLAEGALERGSEDPEVLWRSAFVLAWCGEQDLQVSVHAMERGVALNPNSAAALTHSGWVNLYAGNYALAGERFRRAMRLSPMDPLMHTMTCGMMAALFFQDEPEAALRWGQEALGKSPHFVTTQRFLAATLVRLGQLDAARAVIRQTLERNPDLRLAATLRGPFRHTPRLALYLDAMRQAGLPD